VVRFGATSTTDDAAGRIHPSGVRLSLSGPALRGLLDRFVGPILQVPPAYAAIKVGGEPMYRRARRGEDVVAAPRIVQIDRLDLISWDGEELAIDVTCSKGTYIRALARDLGEATGAGAYLASLVRTASGPFHREDAATLDDLADAAADGYLDRLLYPLDVALARAPALLLAPEQVARVFRGEVVAGGPAPEGTIARGYDAARGALVAVLRATSPGAWHPEKVFPEEAIDGAA
jgi:tRNA pseudouridine55 synthase